jgi:hypothetical protein
VVVADYIDYSGYWKLKDGVFYERRNACDHPSFHLRENFAEALRRSPTDWQNRLTSRNPDGTLPRVLSGAVVAGELLLGDSENAEQQRILSIYEKALAFEMESFGVARTVYEFRSSVHYNPQFLIIRGISDLVNEESQDNDATRKAWTPRAVAAAATFSSVLVERVLTPRRIEETNPIERMAMRFFKTQVQAASLPDWQRTLYADVTSFRMPTPRFDLPGCVGQDI